jgi:hypothetical protein
MIPKQLLTKKQDVMKRKLIYLPAILIIVSIIFACSKDEEADPQQPADNNPPEYSVKTVEVPDQMSQSNDPGAQEAMSYIYMANSFTGFTGMFNPPQKNGIYKSTNDGPPWIYNWEVDDESGQYTVTMTFDEDNTHYYWSVVIDGVMDGIVLQDFTFLYSEQTKDDSEGLIRLYDPESQDLDVDIFWSTDTDGTYHFTFSEPEYMKIEITEYLDGSGFLAVYDWIIEQFLISFEAEWNADGHGQWWSYIDGILDDQGVW